MPTETSPGTQGGPAYKLGGDDSRMDQQKGLSSEGTFSEEKTAFMLTGKGIGLDSRRKSLGDRIYFSGDAVNTGVRQGSVIDEKEEVRQSKKDSEERLAGHSVVTAARQGVSIHDGTTMQIKELPKVPSETRETDVAQSARGASASNYNLRDGVLLMATPSGTKLRHNSPNKDIRNGKSELNLKDIHRSSQKSMAESLLPVQ